MPLAHLFDQECENLGNLTLVVVYQAADLLFAVHTLLKSEIEQVAHVFDGKALFLLWKAALWNQSIQNIINVVDTLTMQ